MNINWIKAHVNNLGNEIADRAAKTGSMLQPTCQIKNSKAQIKSIIDTHTYKVWDREWQTLPNCRQAFEFYKNIDRSKSKKIYKLNRYDLGILIRYTTGHAHLRRHNKIANTIQPKAFGPHMKYSMENPAEDPTIMDDPDTRCRLCDIKGNQETPMHMVRDCPATWNKRWECFGYYKFNEEEIIDWNPEKLIGFYKHFDLENKIN